MQFGWTSSDLNVGLIGHEGHGKSTLIAAIAKVIALRSGSRPSPFGSAISSPTVEYVTENHHFRFTDDSDGMSISGGRLASAILVVSATDGPMPQTRDHIIAAREAGVSSVVGFLSKCDLIEDSDLLDLVELEVRELLSKYGYPGDDLTMLRGSALAAVNSKSTNPKSREYQCIAEILAAVEKPG
jgi:elongation factor Tu